MTTNEDRSALRLLTLYEVISNEPRGLSVAELAVRFQGAVSAEEIEALLQQGAEDGLIPVVFVKDEDRGDRRSFPDRGDVWMARCYLAEEEDPSVIARFVPSPQRDPLTIKVIDLLSNNPAGLVTRGIVLGVTTELLRSLSPERAKDADLVEALEAFLIKIEESEPIGHRDFPRLGGGFERRWYYWAHMPLRLPKVLGETARERQFVMLKLLSRFPYLGTPQIVAIFSDELFGYEKMNEREKKRIASRVRTALDNLVRAGRVSYGYGWTTGARKPMVWRLASQAGREDAPMVRAPEVRRDAP